MFPQPLHFAFAVRHWFGRNSLIDKSCWRILLLKELSQLSLLINRQLRDLFEDRFNYGFSHNIRP
jgi:hypothetical protein